MKKNKVVLLLAFFLVSQSVLTLFAQNKADNPKMDWWKEAKFGMFIHWGLYSIPGGEWKGQKTQNIAEWILNDLKIPVGDYKALASKFNPVKFNADEFVLLAKEAGMKYIVITAKHHEGFAMFKSSDPFNIVDATPYKKDIVKSMADACKKYNMHFGLYYSQAQDWTHPGGGMYQKHWDAAQEGSFDKYLDDVAVPQVKEILNAYNPGIIWWDTPAEMTKERAAKFASTLAKYPKLITNNRLGGDVEGDLETPEQYIPATGYPGKNWESCMTMNGTWGFSSSDHNWKSSTVIIQNLIDIASKGGNYLLNVGPTPEGLIPQPSINLLKEVGAWMKLNGEAIYGTTASPFNQLARGRATQKRVGGVTKLYLHVFEWPATGKLVVSGLENKLIKAYALVSPKTSLKMDVDESNITIDVSKVKQTKVATVIVLEIKGKPVINDAPTISTESSIYMNVIEFQITTNTKNGVIHYTTNGSEPINASLVAKEKILLNAKGELKIKARTFVNGKPVSASSEFLFKQENPLPPVYESKPGLNFRYFTGCWERLPDFSKLLPLKTGVLENFNLKEKTQNTCYGFVFDGYINVPETNVYSFYLSSDDGSKLILDDIKILDNDGPHTMTEKYMAVALSAGLHKISVQFFQNSGDEGLKLEWKQTGKPRTSIDNSALSH